MLIQTNSAEETRALGEKLSKRLQAGDVVVLEGDLGAVCAEGYRRRVDLRPG